MKKRWRLQVDFKYATRHTQVDYYTWIGAWLDWRRVKRYFGDIVEFHKIRRITI